MDIDVTNVLSRTEIEERRAKAGAELASMVVLARVQWWFFWVGLVVVAAIVLKTAGWDPRYSMVQSDIVLQLGAVWFGSWVVDVTFTWSSSLVRRIIIATLVAIIPLLSWVALLVLLWLGVIETTMAMESFQHSLGLLGILSLIACYCRSTITDWSATVERKRLVEKEVADLQHPRRSDCIGDAGLNG